MLEGVRGTRAALAAVIAGTDSGREVGSPIVVDVADRPIDADLMIHVRITCCRRRRRKDRAGGSRARSPHASAPARTCARRARRRHARRFMRKAPDGHAL